MDIISAYREMGSYRGAAAISGTTPKTVRRVIARHEGGSPPQQPRVRAHNYDDVIELVMARVEKTGGRISAKRLLPVAQAAGYAGSARNFRRLVSEQKALWRKDNPRGRRPAVWSPGQHLVIDWGVLGGLHVFCAVLAWSRVRFVRFADNERADTTMTMLVECFEVLGGVPGVVLTDRMGCLKGGVVANVVVPTPAFVSFAAHYGFRPDFCQAADPESKGIVENLVGYAKTDLMIPGAGDNGDAFTDLNAANAAAAVWCREVNGIQHSQIQAVPAERLLVERELLATLPSLRPSLGRSVTRKVDRLSCVRFASARYSVPTRLIGQQVTLWVDADRSVSIMATDSAGALVMVCEHLLVAPGEASVRDEHYGGPRPEPRRTVRPRTVAEKQFCALGPVAEAFITGAAASGNTRLGWELAELNQLRAAHGEQVFLAALERAVAFSRWHAGDVRSILAAGTGIAKPRRAGDALIIELPAVSVRSLDDYAITATRARS